jgi:two-component system, NarL family, response regulator LiaR
MHSRPLRVLIAEDDPLARTALRGALRDDSIEIVAEAALAAETIELAEALQPDVVVMDVGLNRGPGNAVIRFLNAKVPACRVLVLANTIDTELAVRTLRAGADGYLSKDLDMAVLPRIIEALVAGEAVIPRKLMSEVIEHLRGTPDLDVGTRPVRSNLTPREWEVLDLLCTGQSTAAIADTLVVTGETVRSHIKNILRKLGVTSRAEAVEASHALRRSNHYEEAGGPGPGARSGPQR